jgi:hypothetical protein
MKRYDLLGQHQPEARPLASLEFVRTNLTERNEKLLHVLLRDSDPLVFHNYS